MTDPIPTRSRAAEASEDFGRNDSDNPTMGEIVARRFSRRDVMRGSLAVAAISATLGEAALAAPSSAGAEDAFDFKEIEAGVDETHHVAEGYDADVLMRWGDPVLPGAPAFDPRAQTAAAQRLQFGYNNDFLGFVALDETGDRALLVVNHEYTNEELMFPGLPRQETKAAAFSGTTREIVEIEIAAHGGSVLEIVRAGGKWSVVEGSAFARRIDAETEMRLTGPAAGDPRLRTAADPAGTTVRGMVNNCAGGVTPWGTWLTCEENINFYFAGKVAESHGEARNHKRMGISGEPFQAWGRFHDRFDVEKEANEPNRFGWVVEIDPRDPASTPKKRTALGRFKHEGAANVVNGDGRFVVYQGDDERFEYVYKFVTAGRVAPGGSAANADLLDEGVLYVARFDADGRGRWMPLVFGEGQLTAENGFASQADVLIEPRRAGDLLKATRMDRPEDVEASPKTGRVYVMLTNNTRRTQADVDAANPRAKNAFGHIVEIAPDGGDHAAEGFSWEVLVRCGDPAIAEVGAAFSSQTTKNGWFGMPDNSAFDAKGRLWVATDGNNAKASGRADGIWAIETEGERRGTSKHFFRVPAGAEMCGPCFTPDGTTLFLAVQHPGESDDDKNPATFENPATRWPDFRADMPPRPSIVAITKRGGGAIA